MSDTFRVEYKELTEEQKDLMKRIKEKAGELYALYAEALTQANGRENALGKTNLEQSVMWVVKGITG